MPGLSDVNLFLRNFGSFIVNTLIGLPALFALLVAIGRNSERNHSYVSCKLFSL